MQILLLLLVSWSPLISQASDLSMIESECEFRLAPVNSGSRERFADFIQLPSGAELFVRIEQPRLRPAKRWFFLVHGLLESHRSYDAVAKRLLAQGYGVVRMDLRGFARSLHREIQNSENNDRHYLSESHVDHTQHVQDLKELLLHLKKEFGIRRPHPVGHSMGGGLLLALLSDPENSGLVAPRATVIAPYVYRLDYYLIEKLTTLGLPLPSPLRTLDRLIPNIARIAPEYFIDTFLSDRHMRRMMGEYFDTVLLSRELDVPAERLSEVRRRHIQSAIASTKGMRGFNALSAIQDVPANIRVDLIYGDDDPVVERRQARQLGVYIEGRGGQVHELQSGHMLLEEVPEHLVESLIRP